MNKPLDQELKKLTEVLGRLMPMMQQDLLNYRTLETQHSQLQERNMELSRQNLEAEEKIRKAVEAADAIVAEARAEAQTTKASISTLHARAQVKYKELEKNLEDADRKVIKKSLKELEEVAA